MFKKNLKFNTARSMKCASAWTRYYINVSLIFCECYNTGICTLPGNWNWLISILGDGCPGVEGVILLADDCWIGAGDEGVDELHDDVLELESGTEAKAGTEATDLILFKLSKWPWLLGKDDVFFNRRGEAGEPVNLKHNHTKNKAKTSGMLYGKQNQKHAFSTQKQCIDIYKTG